jgi:hypothetical protein
MHTAIRLPFWKTSDPSDGPFRGAVQGFQPGRGDVRGLVGHPGLDAPTVALRRCRRRDVVDDLGLNTVSDEDHFPPARQSVDIKRAAPRINPLAALCRSRPRLERSIRAGAVPNRGNSVSALARSMAYRSSASIG